MTARRVARTKLPSAGFCALVFVHLGLFVFLLWGSDKPALERVWELHHELKIGDIGRLDSRDADLLRAAMQRHPELAESLLGEGQLGLISAHSRGWLETAEATVLRAADAPDPCSMELETSMPNDAFPVTIDIESQGWQKRVVSREPGLTKLSLPTGRKIAEIISLRVVTHTPHEDGETLGIRLGFGCAGRSAGK